MTPEEIRAEAIELIARDRFARGVGLSGKTWDELPEWAATYLESAAHAVAAIDHLLPTEVVWAIAWVNQYGEHERQTDSIECRADAERFGEQYEERHPHLTTSLHVEHQYLTAWTGDPA